MSLFAIGLSIFFMVSIIRGIGLFSSHDYSLRAKATLNGQKYQAGAIMTAMVDKVLYGDTIILSSGEKVIYKGAQAPKAAPADSWIREYEIKAYEMNKRLVENKRVTLEFESKRKGKNDNLFAYVYVDDVFVNTELVHEGLAMITGSVKEGRYGRFFDHLQHEAKLFKRGIRKYVVSPDVADTAPVQGSNRSKIYHLAGGKYFDLISPANRVYFAKEEAARQAGYRPSRY